MVNTYDHVYSTVWSAFEAFFAKVPDGHPLIGDLTEGKTRLPKNPKPKYPNSGCWENKVKGLARKIKKVGVPQSLPALAGWLSTNVFSVAREIKGKNVTFCTCR